MIVYELPSANIRINRARLTSSAGRVRDRRRAVSSSLSGTFNSKLDLSISHRAFTHGQEWSRNRWYDPLGLTSMRERLKLVRGTISIDSHLGHGTTIQARIPW